MAKRKRDFTVSFRATEEEKSLIQAKMELAKISNMRSYLLKMAIDGYVIRLDLSDIRELIFLLRNATNNLNQIAKRMNETNNIYQADIKDLQEHYDSLWGKTKEVLENLAKI